MPKKQCANYDVGMISRVAGDSQAALDAKIQIVVAGARQGRVCAAFIVF